MNKWKRVKYASELKPCECCEEPWCETHNAHYWECECPGPHQEEEYEYEERKGVLWARLRMDNNPCQPIRPGIPNDPA